MDADLTGRVEADLHVEEFKVRLKPADADLLRALARRRDVPPAVLLRAIVVQALGPVAPGLVVSVPARDLNRRG